MTKLTIAIPNYNGGENLERAIESCRNINIPTNDYEILIIDNCSTDNSINIINKLKDEFSNIVLVENKENVGRIQNWNVCIENAKGKLLAANTTTGPIGTSILRMSGLGAGARSG